MRNSYSKGLNRTTEFVSGASQTNEDEKIRMEASAGNGTEKSEPKVPAGPSDKHTLECEIPRTTTTTMLTGTAVGQGVMNF